MFGCAVDIDIKDVSHLMLDSRVCSHLLAFGRDGAIHTLWPFGRQKVLSSLVVSTFRSEAGLDLAIYSAAGFFHGVKDVRAWSIAEPQLEKITYFKLVQVPSAVW